MKKILIICMFVVLSYSADIEVKDAIISAPPPFSRLTSGFMTIHSKLKKDIKLIKIKSDIAYDTEVHKMEMKDGMMMMYPVTDINISAQSSTSFQAGVRHIMFIDLKEKLKVNDKKKVKLFFSNGKKIDAWFDVKKITK